MRPLNHEEFTFLNKEYKRISLENSLSFSLPKKIHKNMLCLIVLSYIQSFNVPSWCPKWAKHTFWNPTLTHVFLVLNVTNYHFQMKFILVSCNKVSVNITIQTATLNENDQLTLPNIIYNICVTISETSPRILLWCTFNSSVFNNTNSPIYNNWQKNNFSNVCTQKSYLEAHIISLTMEGKLSTTILNWINFGERK